MVGPLRGDVRNPHATCSCENCSVDGWAGALLIGPFLYRAAVDASRRISAGIADDITVMSL